MVTVFVGVVVVVVVVEEEVVVESDLSWFKGT
jgi:hypothetical protein